MGTIRRLARSNSGAAAVEFAIIAWALIFVCLAVIEFGRGLHVRNELSFAADHAARLILTNPMVSVEQLELAVDNAVKDGLIDSELDSFIVKFGDPELDTNGIAFRTMLIQYPFSLLIPGLSDTITLTVSRRVPIG